MLMKVLDDFGVKGSSLGAKVGPVVTLHEFEPAAGATVQLAAPGLERARRGPPRWPPTALRCCHLTWPTDLCEHLVSWALQQM